MKIYANKLAAELKKEVRPIYIVSGDEPLLVQESTDLIRHKLKESGFTDREVFHVDANFDWQQLMFSANSMSLFAEQKILELRMSSSKTSDKGATLRSFAENPPEGTVLLLVMPKVDQGTQKTKWFSTLEKAGLYVQIWPIDIKELPRWIDARFKHVGLTASRDAVALMSERIEGNLLAAVQEIERLKLVANNGKIDVKQVMQGVADNSRYDVFTLIDTALAGDANRTLKIIQGLELEGVEMLYITAMLSKELRSLAVMADEMQISSLATALQKGRVWQKRKSLISRCLREHNSREFQQLLSRVADIDGMVKGIYSGNPWSELTSIMLHLAGTQVLPRQC